MKEKKTTIDTDSIDYLTNKNTELLTALKPICEWADNELSNNDSRKKPIRVGNAVSQHIFTELSKYSPMANRVFDSMDVHDFQHMFQKFMEFAQNFAIYEVPITKQFLCAYMGIAVTRFDSILKNDNDSELKEYVDYINSTYLNGLLFASAESGNNDSKSIITRGKIKEAGQNMRELKEEIYLPPKPERTEAQLMEEFRKLLG